MRIPPCGRYCVHFVFTTLGYHPESIGGAFRYVAALAEGLARRGHIVEAVFPANEIENLPPTRHAVNLHRIQLERGLFWRNWLQRNSALRKRLLESRLKNPAAIVVCCHGYFARATTSAGGPMVSLFTGPWSEEFLRSRKGPFASLIAAAMRRVERSGLRASRSIFTISKYFEASLRIWHPNLQPPIHVIGGGVDYSHFRSPENRDAVRANFGVRNGDFIFLAVRRLEPRMGLANLIDAFSVLQSEFPQAQLWIAGSGSLRDDLERRVRSCGAQARLLGFVSEDELPLRYAAADCAVMPSLDLEGFGLATVESLACGTPVIGSRRGATPELLEPLSNNLLYDSQEDLVNRLRLILRGLASLPSREQCRQYAVTRYNWERPVAEFEGVCSTLFGGRA